MYLHFKYPLVIPATQKNHTKGSCQRGQVFGLVSENDRYPMPRVALYAPSRTLWYMYPDSDTIVSVMGPTGAL